MNNKFKTLFSNTAVFAVGNVLVKLISFFLMPLYTSQLTTEQYGIAELLNSSIHIAIPLATLCIVDALFRFSIDEDADHKAIMSTSINLLIKSFIIVFIVCIIFYSVSGYEYTYYFYFLFVATTLRRLFSQFARGLGHVKLFAVSGVFNAVTLVIMNVILLIVYNGGVEAYLNSLIISQLLTAIFSFITSKEYLYIDFKAVDKSLLRLMLVFSVPNVPNMLSWWLNNVSSRYIISGFAGVGIAGMFTAASKLPSVINMLSTIFQQAWQFSASKEIENEDSNIFFSDVFKYYSAFIFITCSGLIVIIPYFSKLILRGDFYEAWVYVPLLLLSASIGSFSIYFGSFYTAVKNNFMAMVSTGSGATANIILNFLLVPFIGVYGALIASVVGYLIITIIRIVDTRKHVSLKIDFKFLAFRFIIVLIQASILTVGTDLAKIISLICFVIILIIHFSLIKIGLKFVYDKVRRII